MRSGAHFDVLFSCVVLLRMSDCRSICELVERREKKRSWEFMTQRSSDTEIPWRFIPRDSISSPHEHSFLWAHILSRDLLFSLFYQTKSWNKSSIDLSGRGKWWPALLLQWTRSTHVNGLCVRWREEPSDDDQSRRHTTANHWFLPPYFRTRILLIRWRMIPWIPLVLVIHHHLLW